MTLEVWKAGKPGNVRKSLGSEWLGKSGELYTRFERPGVEFSSTMMKKL